MISKFKTLYENSVTRFSQGGFVRGDYVKLKKNAASHPAFKNAAQQIKDSIVELVKSEDCIRVSNIMPLRNTKDYDLGNGPSGFLVTIHLEINSGLSGGHITVPMEVLELDASYYDSATRDVPAGKVREANPNHTNRHPTTADLQDNSYDTGKDYRGK